jgi:2-polyprenyl-6-methoxyphenol hydroxylase-like FAD-dependent oxidoreductase
MTVNGANGSNGHQERVTVGIVGGGVGGLALARMLEMAGVSYILFEANELVPRVGASVGILPPGMRILDQIRALDDVEKWKVPHDRWEHRDGTTGKLYRTSKALRALTEL